MGGGLAVAAVAWWIRDQIVGLAYLVVGGFVLLDGFLVARLAMERQRSVACCPGARGRFPAPGVVLDDGPVERGSRCRRRMVLAGLGSFALAGQDRDAPVTT